MLGLLVTGLLLCCLEGSGVPTEPQDLRSRFYAVVSARGLEAATIFRSAASYWKLIGRLADSPSISQFFPSEQEFRIYLEAAGFPDPVLAP